MRGIQQVSAFVDSMTIGRNAKQLADEQLRQECPAGHLQEGYLDMKNFGLKKRTSTFEMMKYIVCVM